MPQVLTADRQKPPLQRQGRLPNWCPRPESNRHALRRGIFFPLRLSPPPSPKKRRSWAGARLHHSLSALGARRLLSTPSEEPFGSRAWLGISSDLRPGPSPSLTGFTSGVSPGGLKFGLSPLRLPISPLGHDARCYFNYLLLTGSQLASSWLLADSWLEMQASRSRGDLSLNPLSHAAWQAVASSKNYVEVPIFESPASTNFTTRAGAKSEVVNYGTVRAYEDLSHH